MNETSCDMREGQDDIMNDGAEWKPPIAPPRALASLILTSASTRSIQWMKDPCNDNRSGTIAISNGKGPVAPPDDLARYAMLLTGRCQSPLTKGGHSLKTSKLWRCCECECTFSSKGALTVHVLQTQHGIHFDGKGKCSKRSNSASTTGAGRNNLEKYCCIQCGARYRSTQALGLHNAMEHRLCGRIKCEKCGARFSNGSVLSRHVKTVHLKQRRWECKTCKSRFGQKSHLEKHVRTVHREGARLQCDGCDARFSRSAELEAHRKTQHEVATRDSASRPLF